MPAFSHLLQKGTTPFRGALESTVEHTLEGSTASYSELSKRIYIPLTPTSPPGLVEADTVDPWIKSGKYALGWVYFCIIILVGAIVMRCYNLWSDKIRVAFHKEKVQKEQSLQVYSPSLESYEMSGLSQESPAKLFPRSEMQAPESENIQFSFRPLNIALAGLRWVFYRPTPVFQTRMIRKMTWTFPSFAILFFTGAALIFVTLYCFVPQPLYWQSIQYGSPPLAIRSGMIAVSMIPWIIAMSMKANFVSFLTGIGHERLNVLHRWGGYLCLFLALLHTIPFYIQPVWDQGGMVIFSQLFNGTTIIYGSGIAALVPLLFLCVSSVPLFRKLWYELFVLLHVPVAIVFLGMMFWHCANYLTSWNYLFATVGIWVSSYMVRLLYLNWTNPFRLSWLIGDEAAITLLPENAVKVTIPTQVKWKPGQYVYLRMPGISVFENHPFTIASLCSDDFPSTYGPEYRDMTLVFRPFAGFTRKCLVSALEYGPFRTYRAFLDGPYGGMKRQLDAFDNVILFAGGSGITALVSHLLDLVKRMRDGKAVTKHIEVIWAIKRPESMQWFAEEIRICREFAPPESIHIQFFITAAKRQEPQPPVKTPTSLTHSIHDKIEQGLSGIASKRNSALIREEAAGDPEKERELRAENEDSISALPIPTLRPPPRSHQGSGHLRSGPLRPNAPLSISVPAPSAPVPPHQPPQGSFDFGFPSTPTVFQKSLMRFAFMPMVSRKRREGWSVEYGRPDIPYMLHSLAREGLGKRTCVFVCGPPGMRKDVQSSVAGLQSYVWESDSVVEEVAMHCENYAY